jgi:large subunit ribosomal protein L17
MVTSLLEHEQIETTDAKAKELRRVADKMITLGKRGDLHARRQAARFVRTSEVANKLFGALAERYKERPGGYTRVLKVRTRPGDAAPISIIELVDRERQAAAKTAPEKPGKAEKKQVKKAAKKAAADKPVASKGRKKAAAG